LVTIVVLEAVLGLSFGWWYLNRKSVRGWFGVQPRAIRRAMDKAMMEDK
jgi:hypothetical protein